MPKNNYLYGDAQEMHDNARGGGDTLRGGKDGSTNFLFGDSLSMSDNARDGDDMLFGGSRPVLGATENVLYGDAYSMSDNARGGDDWAAAPGDKPAPVLPLGAGGQDRPPCLRPGSRQTPASTLATPDAVHTSTLRR